MGRVPHRVDEQRADRAARGHQSTTRPRRLQGERPVGAARLALDPVAALHAAELFVGHDYEADRLELRRARAQHRLERVGRHRERALHIADAGAAGPVAAAGEAPAFDGSGGPDRIGMSQDQEPAGAAEAGASPSRGRRGRTGVRARWRTRARSAAPPAARSPGRPGLVVRAAVDIHQSLGQGEHRRRAIAQGGQIIGGGSGHSLIVYSIQVYRNDFQARNILRRSKPADRHAPCMVPRHQPRPMGRRSADGGVHEHG